MNSPRSEHPVLQQTSFSIKQVLLLVCLTLMSVSMKAAPYLLKRMGWELEEADVVAYLWHFSPLLPLAVVLGANYSARTAVILASLIWLLGDLGIWAASGRLDWAFYTGQPIVYLCLWLVVGAGYLGSRLRKQQSTDAKVLANLASGFVGAALFFVVSNFFVWALGNDAVYTPTLGGLIECYAMAIPFHQYDFISMLIFVPLFTRAFALCAEKQAVTAPEAAVLELQK